MKAAVGSTVTLTYELSSQSGEHTESSGDEPVEVVLGESELLPGLDRALTGCEPGAKLDLTLSPADAFGDYDPEQLSVVPLDELPPEASDLKRGDWLPVVIEEDDGSQDELELRVLDVNDEAVYLDANHPLAGQEVQMSVVVLDVRPGQ